MNFLNFGAKMISKTSPLLLVASGVAIALAFFPDRRDLRSAAVTATKGALAAKDKMKNVAEELRTGYCPKDTKAKGRRIAVTATKKVLTLKEKAQTEFQSIVEEAKEQRAARYTECKRRDQRNYN